jgi:hypothetical protein
MAKRLFAALTRTVARLVQPVTLQVSRPRFMLGGTLVLAVLILGVSAAASPTPTTCNGLCQCWYWEHYRWEDGRYVTSGPCLQGCVGACQGVNNCVQVPGQGGCGPICACRNADCRPTPTPAPTQPPPPTDVACPLIDKVNLLPPAISKPTFEPDYPVVLAQDPTKYGFKIHLVFTGGRYEHWIQRLWQGECLVWSTPEPGKEAACLKHEYTCENRCVECYDDPLNLGLIHMRLADSSLAWINGELQARYPGAHPQEGLPHSWDIKGVQNKMRYDAWWTYKPGQPDSTSSGPIDPGIHGGRIVITTKGTPKSAPQTVQTGYSVPVYLPDSTIVK